MKYKSQRGTHDIVPGDNAGAEFNVARWHHLEKTFFEVVGLYGYREVRSPMFEDYELFARSSGETSDIVSKEMYDFYDKGDRHIALRPEGTAPALRAFIEHNLGLPTDITRLSYFVQLFRYGRPGKGRFRQLHQVGFELIGSPEPDADCEVIELTHRILSKLGVRGLKVKLNSIGGFETRSRYGESILSHLSSWLMDQDDAQRAQAGKNPMRLLDSKDPGLKVALDGVPSISNFLDDASKSRFEKLQTLLTEAGVHYEFDDRLVRGLDYYNDTVFECSGSTMGDDTSLCGGGRYDPLMKLLGGPDVPCVGVGIGVERVIAEMIGAGLPTAEPKLLAYVIADGDAARARVRAYAAELRDRGFAVQCDVAGRNIKGQFKQADRCGAKFALILGEEEIRTQQIRVKDLVSVTQETLSPEQVIERLINS